MFWGAITLIVIMIGVSAITGSSFLGFWIPVTVVVVLGIWMIYATLTKDSRLRKVVEETLTEPIGLELPQQVVDRVPKAVYLGGTKTPNGRVISDDSMTENWLAIAEELEVTGKEKTNYVVELVCDPANEQRENAVLVTMGGLVLGYVPNTDAQPLFDFLMGKGGIGRCNAVQTWDMPNNQLSLKYSLRTPFELVSGA